MPSNPRRKAPSSQTLRTVYLRSGGHCAFPGCIEQMLDDEDNFIGQVCHIEAAMPGGERYNPAMTEEDRGAASNLMLMCYPHHVATNDVARYPVATLRDMKANHERQFRHPTPRMRVWAADERRVAKTFGAMLAGAGAVEALREIGALFGLIKKAFRTGEPQPKTPQASLGIKLYEILRLTPTGTVVHLVPMGSERPQEFFDEILGIFQSAGWRCERRSGDDASFFQDTPNILLFEMTHADQVEIAGQGINQFFLALGFILAPRKSSDRSRRFEGRGSMIKIFLSAYHR